MLLVFILAICSFKINAATVDTVSIYSKAMNKEYKCVVIKPSLKERRNVALPVVYLLHGYGGWYSNWITRVPDLTKYADEYKLMIVCPEGMNSWYLDSPVDSSSKFETYVAEEVITYIDKHYNTIKDRKGRAITGLSMGGHGGLFLAFRHPETFGACGSISGGVDLRPFPKSWQLVQRLGDTTKYAVNWNNYSVVNVIDKYPKDSLAITFDCGTEDFFYDVNKALHEKMLRLKIPHDYTERPGKHDWVYWRTSIPYHLLFFRKYFDKMKEAGK